VNGMVTALMGNTKDEAKLQFRLRLYTVLSFFVALLLGGVLSILEIRLDILRKQHDAEIIAANQAALLEERLSRSLSATYALAAVVRQGGGKVDRFHTLASEMLKLYGGLSSLQLAKDGIITDIEPLAGNEAAIGHNLLLDPKRNKEAFLSLDTRRLTLAGPFELLQGGVAVIGRLPIFMQDDKGKDIFWGFSTAVITIPELLSASGLPKLSNAGYRYELAHIHPDRRERTVFSRSGNAALRSPVVRAFDIPNGKWFLSIEPEEGWIHPLVPYFAGGGALIVAVLIAIFTHTTLRQPLLLQRKVNTRTQELALMNHNLNEEILERERAQETAQHINRLYAVLSRTNIAIVRIGDPKLLLEEICRIAVEEGGFPLARIALIDSSQSAWNWTASHGVDVDLPDCDDMLPGCLVNKGELPAHAQVRVCSSIPISGRVWHPLCRQALAAGFKSHVVMQLKTNGQIRGAFSLYAREPNCFDAAQLHLLEEMTEDVSFALENIGREAKRKQAEEKLRKLSRAVEQSASAVLITDRHGIIEYVNPWFTRITGYREDEVIGKTPRILKSVETHPETHKRLWDTLLSGKEWTGELHNTKKNGDLYWCLETISPLKNENGDITHFVAVTEDISERKQAEQTIRHLAFHDPLTGLPNRRLFRDRLAQAAAARNRDDNAFALLLLDLDHFKTINDTLGHDMGDALLKAVASRLSNHIRQGDTLARMGGDEFALIATGFSQPEDMAHLAGKLLEALKVPFNLGTHEVYVTTSIGLTLYPTDTADVDALVKNADIALYRAKDAGRNNFQFFTQDMNVAIMHRLKLESSMRRAIERSEFLLHYQPQVDLATGKIHGTEALIRWNNPEFGMVSPADFIPVAEDTGMIVQIGEWVLRTACAQAKAWERGGMPMRVAVNLSARQFIQDDLAETIADILLDTGLDPAMLEVELTESILMKDTSTASTILNKLHAMGVQISIDDFGTGYSSLSYLKRLPIQLLKIDQSFVRDIHTDPDDRAIVTAVIALAHSLKLHVVAEGVETEEQLAFLRQYNCDILQGYLFSRPVTGDAVMELLRVDKRLEFPVDHPMI
jgi:diguanylate cyclase (GGDEF)-like protein/PAS domain S-box-containing protein